MPGPDHHLVHLGTRCGPLDAAHRRRLADVVDFADERQDRAGDVGQRHQLTVDREAARHHPVVRDELLEQFGDRRTRPGDPALAVQEAALLLARQQGLAVVELAHEVDARLGGLERVEHLEAGARHPAGDVDPVEHVVGDEVGGDRAEVGGNAHRQRGQGVHR